jgi:hypothetical protein
MAELTLHFDAEPGMDSAAVAQILQQRCAQLIEVEAARSQPVQGERVVGVDDILLVLTLSAKLLGATALTLEALNRVIVAAKHIAHELGLQNLRVEADGGAVPPEQLTEDDAKFIATGQA